MAPGSFPALFLCSGSAGFLLRFCRVGDFGVGSVQEEVCADIVKICNSAQGSQWDFVFAGFISGIGFLSYIEVAGYVSLSQIFIFPQFADSVVGHDRNLPFL